jgi:hypothetical protein
VTRSIAGSQRNRRFLAVSFGIAAIFAGAALAGCGAGQLADTSEIVSAVPGGQALLGIPTAANPNGAVGINNATVDYHGVSGYAAGDTAPLSLSLVNSSTERVTVTPGQARLVSPNTAATTLLGPITLSSGTTEVHSLSGVAGDATASAVPAAPSASAVPATPSAAPSASASASASATPSSVPSGPVSTAPAPVSIDIDPGTLVVLSMSVSSGAQHMQLPMLREPLVPGAIVELTFNVTAGGQPIGSTVVTAPMAPPEAPAPRVSASGFPPSESSS